MAVPRSWQLDTHSTRGVDARTHNALGVKARPFRERFDHLGQVRGQEAPA